MLVDPLLTPTNWMVLQDDQHRSNEDQTTGISGEQSQTDWLSPLRVVVEFLKECKIPPALRWLTPPPLSTVNWIQERLTLYDRSKTFSLALVEVS